ncbi:hypothetical protein RI367_003254 [Sorochytrium milnesiophthora]
MAQLYKTETGRMFHAGTICLAIVGLPLRGKTFLSRKLSRFLRWLGVKTEVFNVGTYRRNLFGANVSHTFFDPANEEGRQKREQVAQLAFDDMIEFYRNGGQVGIYDSAMLIREQKRSELAAKLETHNVKVVFIETICEDQAVISSYMHEVKEYMPDYVGWDENEAADDFRKRIEHHVPYYNSLSDRTQSYIQVVNMGVESNFGEHIECNNIKGYLQTRIVLYLMNLHATPRTIYLMRNGESTSEASFREDPPLSEKGREYGRQAAEFFFALRQKQQTTGNLKALSSTRIRSAQTAEYFDQSGCVVEQRSALVELNPGAVQRMTAEQIQQTYPEEYRRHETDMFNHRYPRGESFHDVCVRLESILLEMEREKDDLLIIAHETVLKCLYAYLMDRDEKEIPALHIALGTLIELHPRTYGVTETVHQMSSGDA